jgi:predicted enzyme related to lactoylglutathione lyase
MSHPVVHFEWAVKNPASIARWYADLFDFKFTDMPQMDYATVSWQQEAGINGGGFMPPTDEVPEGTLSLYFYTEDVDAHMARIVAAGGTAVGESHTAPGIGTWWRFKDPAGNFAAVIKTDPSGLPE